MTVPSSTTPHTAQSNSSGYFKGINDLLCNPEELFKTARIAGAAFGAAVVLYHLPEETISPRSAKTASYLITIGSVTLGMIPPLLSTVKNTTNNLSNLVGIGCAAFGVHQMYQNGTFKEAERTFQSLKNLGMNLITNIKNYKK